MRGKSKLNEGIFSGLILPDHSVANPVVNCPVFSRIWNTPITVDITEEHIEGLPDDLETLLSSVNGRLDILNKDMSVILDLNDKSVDSPAAKIPKTDNPYTRSLRDTPCRSEANSPAPVKPRPYNKKVGSEAAVIESLGRPLKSDAPEKFWALVEPYCADITSDDMKILEDMLRSHENDMDFHRVPSLGKHYSLRWMNEDQQLEKRDGAKLVEKKAIAQTTKNRLDSSGETCNSSIDDTVNKLDHHQNDVELESSPFGSLTQRLVSALIEENSLSSAVDNQSNTTDLPTTSEDEELSPSEIIKQFNITSTSSLENKIRQELLEQGILDLGLDFSESFTEPDEEKTDEVLEDLKQKQEELKIIGQHNLSTTKRLYKLAKDEMVRQDIRRKLAVLDADVMEGYKKIQQAKLKKRPPTKREKDFVMKSIKERESLVKQLDSIGA